MKIILGFLLLALLSLLIYSCQPEQRKLSLKEAPFVWEGANTYFLLTDRFLDGNDSTEVYFDRTQPTAKLRGFEGGNIRGVIQKIEEGYFDELGVNAIWMTPLFEQIHGGVDEGTGFTYPYHGYWPKDWTALDPNFGSYADLQELVQVAHKHGIRLLMDVVLNHTGPVTEKDPQYPDNWVRTGPRCTYENQATAVTCTLVDNLPDIKTEADYEVELPPQLVEKWRAEGRLEEEQQELNQFFQETGLARTPANYIIKWLTDYVRELGIDGYRVDTVKHVEEEIWKELAQQAQRAFKEWKSAHPDAVLDQADFYMLGEIYGYSIGNGRIYDFGDTQVDFFDHGFDNLINFQFKYDAEGDYEAMFSTYDSLLQGPLKGKSVMNYGTSHDDGQPFDAKRERTYELGTKLLLTPGVSQIYYGDESGRSLIIPGTSGDATLRSPMNWDAFAKAETQELLAHWQKLGQFRRDHPAVGAGKHRLLSKAPYLFSRIYTKEDFEDRVLIGLDLDEGLKTIPVAGVFEDGTVLRDRYSDSRATVSGGELIMDTPHGILLLEVLE
ncbi:alpha-amylase family glycosyl hydrolase [Croceiramulus getboli]